MLTLEISVDSLESALASEQGGAQRVELCSALREGGLTPSLGLIRAVRARVSMQLTVLIRPRSGDFLYSDEELQLMREDVHIAAEEGVDGIVLGILASDGSVNVVRTQELVAAAHPLPVTFHRAFDLTRDVDVALEDVVRTGAVRILTSGGMPTAMLGQQRLRGLTSHAKGRISIMAGGGVRPANIADLMLATGLSEFHSSMRHTYMSPMQFRVPKLHMGENGFDEYARSVVRAEDVQQLVHELRRAG